MSAYAAPAPVSTSVAGAQESGGGGSYFTIEEEDQAAYDAQRDIEAARQKLEQEVAQEDEQIIDEEEAIADEEEIEQDDVWNIPLEILGGLALAATLAALGYSIYEAAELTQQLKQLPPGSTLPHDLPAPGWNPNGKVLPTIESSPYVPLLEAGPFQNHAFVTVNYRKRKRRPWFGALI